MKKLVLVILGSVLFGFIGSSSLAQPKNEKRMERMEMMKDKMGDKLNLTDEQKNSIEELKIQHQKAMISLNSDIAQKRLEIKEMKLKGNYTREQYVAEVRDLNTIRDKIEIARAEHQMDVYELLNDEQKATWNKMRGDFREHRKDRMEMHEKRMGPPQE
jgi:Spy/CpxP family protein refolding chaperone